MFGLNTAADRKTPEHGDFRHFVRIIDRTMQHRFAKHFQKMLSKNNINAIRR